MKRVARWEFRHTIPTQESVQLCPEQELLVHPVEAHSDTRQGTLSGANTIESHTLDQCFHKIPPPFTVETSDCFRSQQLSGMEEVERVVPKGALQGA